MARSGTQAKPSKRSPYSGNRVGTIPHNRRPTVEGSHAGQYRPPPKGPGPGVPPPGGHYSWADIPSLDATDFSGPGWVQCHPTSHLQEIRFVYGLESIKGEADLLGMGGMKFIRIEEESLLQVKFRDGGWAVYWSKPGTQYTSERLEAIYLQMESDENPGEIIWYSLIGIGASVAWPYATKNSL